MKANLAEAGSSSFHLFCPVCTSNATFFKNFERTIGIPPMEIGEDFDQHMLKYRLHESKKLSKDVHIKITYYCLNCHLELTLNIEPHQIYDDYGD